MDSVGERVHKDVVNAAVYTIDASIVCCSTSLEFKSSSVHLSVLYECLYHQSLTDGSIQAFILHSRGGKDSTRLTMPLWRLFPDKDAVLTAERQVFDRRLGSNSVLYEWSTDKLTILSHSIKLEMLWELMRLYDWRIITYISSFPAQAVKGNAEM